MHCDNHSTLCSGEVVFHAMNTGFDPTQFTLDGTLENYAVERRSKSKASSVLHAPINPESINPQSVAVSGVSKLLEEKSSAKRLSHSKCSNPVDNIALIQTSTKSFLKKPTNASLKCLQVLFFISVAKNEDLV